MEFDKSTNLDICITADICNAIFSEHYDKRRWDNIICEAIHLKDTILSLTDDSSSPPRITWFVRADSGMEKRFGSAAFLFERHGAHLSCLAASGNEIGWHPHIDVRDLKSEMKQLPSIAESVRRFFPVTSVRIGEGFHSNELVRFLSNNGFTVDSTALPGRCNSECRTPFDWRGAPEKIYYPDFDDYRRENPSGTSRLIEVPFTMLPIRLPQDKPGPASRYMNLSYKRELFQHGVMGKSEWRSPVVAITHPAELLPPPGYNEKHPLLSFNEDEPLHNLKFLIYRLRTLGFRIRYKCIRDIPPIYEKEISVETYSRERMREKISGRTA